MLVLTANQYDYNLYIIIKASLFIQPVQLPAESVYCSFMVYIHSVSLEGHCPRHKQDASIISLFLEGCQVPCGYSIYMWSLKQQLCCDLWVTKNTFECAVHSHSAQATYVSEFPEFLVGLIRYGVSQFTRPRPEAISWFIFYTENETIAQFKDGWLFHT